MRRDSSSYGSQGALRVRSVILFLASFYLVQGKPWAYSACSYVHISINNIPVYKGCKPLIRDTQCPNTPATRNPTATASLMHSSNFHLLQKKLKLLLFPKTDMSNKTLSILKLKNRLALKLDHSRFFHWCTGGNHNWLAAVPSSARGRL